MYSGASTFFCYPFESESSSLKKGKFFGFYGGSTNTRTLLLFLLLIQCPRSILFFYSRTRAYCETNRKRRKWKKKGHADGVDRFRASVFVCIFIGRRTARPSANEEGACTKRDEMGGRQRSFQRTKSIAQPIVVELKKSTQHQPINGSGKRAPPEAVAEAAPEA